MKSATTEKPSRAESSRINGAKSTGPRTDEGKRRSAYNRTTHGMRSSRVVLPNESREIYNELHALFFDLFAPRDIFENECVSNMVNARWFIRRLEAATTANIEIAMADSRSAIAGNYQNVTAAHEHAFAFRKMAQMKGHSDILGRYEDRQHRVFDRSYRLLAKHRGKQGVLPSTENLLEAEETVSPYNFDSAHPSETEPVTQNRTIEPETASDLLRNSSNPPPSAAKAVEPEESGDPDSLYRAQFVHVPDFYEALRPYPDLLRRMAEAVIEAKAQDNMPAAA
jgi:hypothetical protein